MLDGLRQTVTEAVGMSGEHRVLHAGGAVQRAVRTAHLDFRPQSQAHCSAYSRSAHSIPQAAHSSAVTGVAFVCILLIVLQWLFPITYTSLGYLSPERVKRHRCFKQLVDVLPIAI